MFVYFILISVRYFELVGIAHNWLVAKGAKPTALMGSSIDSEKLKSSLGTFKYIVDTKIGEEEKSPEMLQFSKQANEIAKALGWEYIP